MAKKLNAEQVAKNQFLSALVIWAVALPIFFLIQWVAALIIFLSGGELELNSFLNIVSFVIGIIFVVGLIPVFVLGIIWGTKRK